MIITPEIAFYNEIFDSEETVILEKEKIPYTIEELRLQAYCHFYKITEENNKVIIVPSRKNVRLFPYKKENISSVSETEYIYCLLANRKEDEKVYVSQERISKKTIKKLSKKGILIKEEQGNRFSFYIPWQGKIGDMERVVNLIKIHKFMYPKSKKCLLSFQISKEDIKRLKEIGINVREGRIVEWSENNESISN